MEKKKSIVDIVTQSGWWRMQRDTQPDLGAEDEKSGLAKQMKSKQSSESENKQVGTEGTLTGIFKKMDFF